MTARRLAGRTMRPQSLVAVLSLVGLVAADPAAGAGRITYRVGTQVFRVAAQNGAAPENVSQALDALSPGVDVWLNISPDGAWLVLETERFDPGCGGFACLAIAPADLTTAEVIRDNQGDLIHPDGFSAVASGGNLVVFEGGGGPTNSRDLWAVSRVQNGWGAPVLLTRSSPYAFNQWPAISADGAKVVFDCGAQTTGSPDTAICEVGTGGAGFRVVLTPEQPPPGFTAGGALHSADYAPDGSLVFEGNWDGERIWRLPAGSTVPVKVSSDPSMSNDNSPCVLPDGSIASLWLERPGNPTGVHELKVMAPDGSVPFMLVTAPDDVADIGLGCGGTATTPSTIPSLSLSLNQQGFGSGDTLVLTATLVPGASASPVDAYIVARLIDGSLMSLQLGGSVVPGLVPLAAGLTPFSLTAEVFRYTFGGAEPAGSYAWLAGLTQAGTVNPIGAVSQLPFTVTP